MSARAGAAGDVAKVSVLVDAGPELAFELFTNEIELWWKLGPKYRIAGKRPGRLCFETGPEGRLFETWEGPSGQSTHVIGRITAWEPPSRLAFTWKGINFAPGEATFVEVSFAPQGRGTLVTVVHGGWSALPAGHPVRHGLQGADFVRMIGFWWSELMTSLREHADARRRYS